VVIQQSTLQAREGATTPSNKELKLTKPGQNGASQLNSSVLRTVASAMRPAASLELLR
jgi:hypothetical protein